MSKELPYFKFYPNDWITGDITLESMEVQGVFANVCAIYWSKDCRVAIAGLSQRYGEAIARLLETSIIKEKDGFAIINFLDEQYNKFDYTHKINSENGKKGNEIRWGKSRGDRHPVALRGEERRGDKNREEYMSFVSLFKKITNKGVRGDKKSERQFNARIKDGYTLKDFEVAIKNCFGDPFHIQNTHHLTCEFITREDKFQKYLLARPIQEPVKEIKHSDIYGDV